MPSQRSERGGRDREAEDDEEVRGPGRDSGSSAAENGLGLKTGPGLLEDKSWKAQFNINISMFRNSRMGRKRMNIYAEAGEREGGGGGTTVISFNLRSKV